MIQNHRQFWSCGSWKLGQSRQRGENLAQIAGFPPKCFILYKYNNFWNMQGSLYGLFLIVYYPLTSNLKLDKNITIYIRKLICLEILEPGAFFVILIAMFVVKKTGFKISQQKISPLLITEPLHFQYPRIFFMRWGIFYFRSMDKNIPAVQKVQASGVGLKVSKYAQNAQNTAKNHPSTLVIQNCLGSDKNGSLNLNENLTLIIPVEKDFTFLFFLLSYYYESAILVIHTHKSTLALI